MATSAMSWATIARRSFLQVPVSGRRPRYPGSLRSQSIPPRRRLFSTSPQYRADKRPASSSDKPAPSATSDVGPSDPLDSESSPSLESTFDASRLPTLVSPADFAASLSARDRLEYDALPPNEQHQYQVGAEAFNKHMSQPSVEARLNSVVARAAHEVELSEPHSDYVPPRFIPGFLSEGEEDEREYPADPEFEEDDITSLAHGDLEQHREIREYARIAAWEMPLLSQLAKPFVPPGTDEPLRFRYTTYLGEQHPAEKKVVLEFCTRDLPGLTNPQREKLIKLVGVRYNPETDIVKMSSEMFETQAQNKRYLGDLVDTLMKEAKDATDTFADVPFDFRHHKFKPRHEFPSAWLMTPERQQYLTDKRNDQLQLEQRKEAEGGLVDGLKEIEKAYATLPLAAAPGAALAQGRGAKRVTASAKDRMRLR